MRDRSTFLWDISSLGVLLVGTLLRWHGLAGFPFEQDELYTIQESRELFSTSLLPGINARPLYYLLHHLVTPLLPTSEMGTRLPAFAFGVAGLFMTWQMGRFLRRGAGGFLAISLCALSPWHLFISGEARYWSLIYLISVSVLYLLLINRERERWTLYVTTSVLIIVGALTHPTFLFPISGLALSTCIIANEGGIKINWPSRKAMFGLWLPAAAVIGGYLVGLKVTGHGGTLSNWSGRGWHASLLLMPAMVQLATPVLTVSAMVGIVFGISSGSIRATNLALLALGGLSSGIVLLFVASTRTDVYADYGASLLPLLIGGATVVPLVADEAKQASFTIGLTAVMIAGMLPETISQFSNGMRFEYRPAFAHIETVAPNRPVLVWPRIIQHHYAPSLAAIEFQGSSPQLDSLAHATSSFWVVASESREGLVRDRTGAIQHWLDLRCRVALRTGVPRFDYRVHRVVLYDCTGDGRKPSASH